MKTITVSIEKYRELQKDKAIRNKISRNMSLSRDPRIRAASVMFGVEPCAVSASQIQCASRKTCGGT